MTDDTPQMSELSDGLPLGDVTFTRDDPWDFNEGDTGWVILVHEHPWWHWRTLLRRPKREVFEATVVDATDTALDGGLRFELKAQDDTAEAPR